MVVEGELVVNWWIGGGEVRQFSEEKGDWLDNRPFPLYHNEKHQLHRAAGNTDPQPIETQDQSTHAWRWARHNSTAASREDNH